MKVGTGGEDSEGEFAVFNLKFYLCSLRAAYPVALGFLKGVGPVDVV